MVCNRPRIALDPPEIPRQQMRCLGIAPAKSGHIQAAPKLNRPLLVVGPRAFQQGCALAVATEQLGGGKQKPDLGLRCFLGVVLQGHGQDSACLHEGAKGKSSLCRVKTAGKTLRGFGRRRRQRCRAEPFGQFGQRQIPKAEPLEIDIACVNGGPADQGQRDGIGDGVRASFVYLNLPKGLNFGCGVLI